MPQYFAGIALGVISLLSQGVLPLLLGSLHAEHRLGASGIGLAASLEAFSITITSSLAGLLLRPSSLRLYAGTASLILALANISTLGIGAESGILAIRAVAGIPEGILFWLAIGMIARSATTERWAGILVTGSNVVSLVSAAALSAYVLERFGANGGFALLAVLSAAGAGIATFMPTSYSALPKGVLSAVEGWRGLGALLGAMLYTASAMGVFIYLVPLANAAGFDSVVSGEALTALLAGQLGGSLIATLIAGRVGYFAVLLGSAVGYLCVWPIYALRPPAWAFITASGAVGLITFFSIPFLYPLTVDADPSRRAAVQSGPAQMMGSALGPFVAAWAVAWYGTLGAVYVGAWILLLAMAVIVVVRRPRVLVFGSRNP
jgi:DHA1 family inner membrane transport protein